MSDSNIPAWEDGKGRRFPTLQEVRRADVCVVGLGGSGLTCIETLQQLGKSVIGVTDGMVGGGAAGRNGGFLLAGTQDFYHRAVATLGRERARAVYRLTLDEIDRMIETLPQMVSRVGSLRIAASDEEMVDCTAQMDAMRADGLDVTGYQGREGRGLLFPRDCAFQPLARCRALADKVTDDGALLFEDSEVLALGEGLVQTRAGQVRCGTVIVAVDGRLELLVPELAGRVRTARLQMLGTAPIERGVFPRPVYSRYGYDYWQQLPDGRVVVGGLRDRFEAEEWTPDSSPSEEVQQGLGRLLVETLGVRAQVTHHWAASVGYTKESLPLLEQVKPGVWVIGGYNGTGNVMGALYGRMVAQLAAEGRSSLAGVFFGNEQATSSLNK